MNKVFVLLFFASGPAIGQSNPDPVAGIWYAKWGLEILAGTVLVLVLTPTEN